MKNLLKAVVILLVSLCSQYVYSQNTSLYYSGTKIVFGISSSEFLNAFSDYKINNESGEPSGITVYSKTIEGIDDYGSNYWFITYFKFFDDKLFMMEINDRWSPEKYANMTKDIVNQFQIVKEESTYDDEVGGSVVKELKNGLLKGYFIDCEEAAIFKCYHTELIKEVRMKTPEYEKNY